MDERPRQLCGYGGVVMSAEGNSRFASGGDDATMSPEDYARWVSKWTATKARRAAQQLRLDESRRTRPVLVDDELADLLDNLAAIAEREAGRDV